MSTLRSQWAHLIYQVALLWYEQDDSYMGLSFDEAQDHINERISKWTVQEFNDYVQSNFTKNESNQLCRVCDSARTACVCQ